MSDLAAAGTFVILGATGAVGSALARRLASRGAALILLARDEGRLASVAGELGARAAVLSGVGAAAVETALTEAVADTQVAGIAHCLGSLLLKPAKATSEAEWLDVLETNLCSAFGVARAAPKLVHKGGSVVFCSSVAAQIGLPNHEAIAAAKAGVEGLTRAVAASNLRAAIRCNCVAPALVRSRMTQALLDRPGMLETVGKRNPSGRIGEAEDIARTIEFLLDPASSWINGQVLGVDGGFRALQAN